MDPVTHTPSSRARGHIPVIVPRPPPRESTWANRANPLAAYKTLYTNNEALLTTRRHLLFMGCFFLFYYEELRDFNMSLETYRGVRLPKFSQRLDRRWIRGEPHQPLPLTLQAATPRLPLSRARAGSPRDHRKPCPSDRVLINGLPLFWLFFVSVFQQRKEEKKNYIDL